MDKGALAGRTVIVTRSAGQSEVLSARLRGLGAKVVELALTLITDASDDGAALQASAAALAGYDWVALASRNAAQRLMACKPHLDGVRVAAVGSGTASAMPRVDLVPERNDADGLVAAFPVGPGRVLIPQAAEGRAALASGLRAKGWLVDVVEAYRTMPLADPMRSLSEDDRAAIASADTVIFAAPSAVRAWIAAAAGASGVPTVATVICMGPTTAAEAMAHGLDVTATADPSTLDGLVAAVVAGTARAIKESS